MKDEVFGVFGGLVLCTIGLPFEENWGMRWLDGAGTRVLGGVGLALLLAPVVIWLGRPGLRGLCLVLTALAGYLVLTVGNVAWDGAPATTQRARVTGGRPFYASRGRRMPSICAWLVDTTSWRGREQERVVLHGPVRRGTQLRLAVRPGAFGFDWVDGVDVE